MLFTLGVIGVGGGSVDVTRFPANKPLKQSCGHGTTSLSLTVREKQITSGLMTFSTEPENVLSSDFHAFETTLLSRILIP
jgi:predicted amidohydrolase